MLPIAILAGGLATRLRPITTHLPKALIEINGEAFVLHQLRLLKAQGITDIVFCVGYLGEMIVDLLGDGAKFGLHIEYSFDGDQLLGTAGALKKAQPLLGEQFFVMYGDSYLPCDFKAVEKAFFEQRKTSLMTVFHNSGQGDKSNVEFAHNTIVRYDKFHPSPAMQYIDYGLGVLTQTACDRIPSNTVYDLAKLYEILLSENQLAGHEVIQRFYEIGSFTGIKELSKYLQE